MESIQLSRAVPNEPSTSRAGPQPAEDRGEKSAFDHHLERQIERAETSERAAKDTPDEESSVKNQESTEQVEADEELTAIAGEQIAEVEDVVEEAVDARSVVDVTLPTTEDVASVESIEAEETTLQNLPQDGKSLPPVMVTDATQVASAKSSETTKTTAQMSATSATTSVSKTATPVTNSVQNAPISQLAAESTDSALANAAVNEFKPGNKTTGESSALNNLATRAGTTPASVASFASSMQQVHQTTSSSAVNLHNPNLPALNSHLSPSLSNSMSSLNTPVQNPAWSQGVADRVAWMVQGNLQTAQIKLNPANLGPMEIKLSVQDDNKTHITFVTSHTPVRDALDAAMPRLRDMLESQGINLADVNVSDSGVQGNQQQDSAEQGSVDESFNGQSSTEDSDGLSNETLISVNQNDGLSIYA